MDDISESTLTGTESGITYLADSVYASYDGYQIKLMTINDYRGEPSNTIYLNEEVLDALYAYVERLNNNNGEQV